MTREQYLDALEKLDLKPQAQRTAALLALSVRHLQRIAAGAAPVPRAAMLLLSAYLRHGLPD